jgi:hypothetical protein
MASLTWTTDVIKSLQVCVGSDSPGVPDSLEAALNKVVPNRWNREFFTHTYEGDDDMPVCGPPSPSPSPCVSNWVTSSLLFHKFALT